MIVYQDRTQLVEDLARMMEELSEPGLTLGRASVLRPEVARILEMIRDWHEPARPRAHPDRSECGCRMACVS